MDSIPEESVDFRKDHQSKEEEEEASMEENEDSILDYKIISEIFKKLPAKSEILLEIFSHFPLPMVFKLKFVSKSVSNLTRTAIFASKHSSNCVAITGFFFKSRLVPHFIHDMNKPEFVSVKDDWNRLPDPSLGFLKQGKDDSVVELIDSCNGLLLCSTTNSIDFIKTCFVCNPLTKESVALPHPKKRSNRVYYALLADLTKSGYLQYKVVCVSMPKRGDPCSKLLILSSETGEWEELDAILPVLSHESMMGSKVVCNGSLFWDCLEGHILIYHPNVKKSQRRYELLEAPRALLGKCLWKCQDKLLCYCHGFPEEFPAWSLCIDEVGGDKKKKMEWKLDGCEDFETMTEDICSKYTETWYNLEYTKPRVRFKIMAYIPETNSVFLWIPDSIYSYELTERRLKHVWGYRVEKFNTPSVALPYLHSLAPIQNRKVQVEEKLEFKEGSGEGNNNIISNAKQYDWMESVLLYENLANHVRPRRK